MEPKDASAPLARVGAFVRHARKCFAPRCESLAIGVAIDCAPGKVLGSEASFVGRSPMTRLDVVASAPFQALPIGRYVKEKFLMAKKATRRKAGKKKASRKKSSKKKAGRKKAGKKKASRKKGRRKKKASRSTATRG
jgi:hypothetical protein